MKSPQGILAATAAIFLTSFTAHGATVWSDDFSSPSHTAGSFPSFDYAGGAVGNDYLETSTGANAKTLISAGIGNAAPGLTLSDTDSGNMTTTVTMNNFAPFTVGPASGTPILRVTFDFRVDSYLSGDNTLNPRFILRADNVNNTGSQLVIGFGHATINDGDASNSDLAFYADTQTGNTSTIPPKESSVIGLNAGTGWAPGFDFGNYNSGSASSNDSNDEFFRITFDYNAISGGIIGSVTQLSTGNSAPFQLGLALTPGTAFSNSADDRFLLATGAGVTATAHFDNFQFETVPEPSTAVLACAGLLGLAARRRRAR